MKEHRIVILLIGMSAIITLVFYTLFLRIGETDSTSMLLVEQEESEVYYESINDHDKILRFQGSMGEYVVEVKSGQVRMLESACPDKLCVKQGFISSAFEPIICLPQKIIISIKNGHEKANYDIIN